jgi:hypothetical protein
MPVRRFPPTGQDNAASAPWCRPKCPKRKPGITDFIGERPDAAHRPVFSQGASVFPAGAPLISSKYFLVERPRRRASRRLLVARSSQKAAQHAVSPGGLSLESPNPTGPDLYPSGLIFCPQDSTLRAAILTKHSMSLRERTRPGLGIIEPCLPSPAKAPPSGSLS